VVNHFKGEIFCSGYGIWIDYKVNPEGHRRLFEIMERCDGEHTVADIAAELVISSFHSVLGRWSGCWRERPGALSRTPRPPTRTCPKIISLHESTRLHDQTLWLNWRAGRRAGRR
jgi:hypothetical protein